MIFGMVMWNQKKIKIKNQNYVTWMQITLQSTQKQETFKRRHRKRY